MPEKLPVLDNRELKDIMEQLMRLSRQHTPEWKSGEDGDAGVMLHRIYARLMEIALERLNRVSEKNLLAFLSTAGIDILPPHPAFVPLTFKLTPGTPPRNIPKGVQAATQPPDNQPAVVFETEDDFTAVQAEISSVYSVDPVYDRYSDNTEEIFGSAPYGFEAFAGNNRLQHKFYLAADNQLDFSKADIDITVDYYRGFNDIPELQDFFRKLVWQIRHNGEDEIIEPVLIMTETKLTAPAGIDHKYIKIFKSDSFIIGDNLRIGEGLRSQRAIITGFGPHGDVFLDKSLLNNYSSGEKVFLESDVPTVRFKGVGSIESSLLQGVSTSQRIRKGINARWLQASIPYIMSELKGATGFSMSFVKMKLKCSNVLMDMAFCNSSPVDLVKEFYPFGELPKEGDALYISCSEAFSKTNAVSSSIVRLDIDVKSSRPQLKWEYYTGNVWKQLTGFSDTTSKFLKNGTISFSLPSDASTVSVGGGSVGFTHYYVRVSISGGTFYPSPMINLLECTSKNSSNDSLKNLPISYVSSYPSNVTTSNAALNPALKPMDSKCSIPFGVKPEFGKTLYLRLPEFTAANTQVKLDLHLLAKQVEWEYYKAESKWGKMIADDETESFTQPGRVTFTYPKDAAVCDINGKKAYWVRARLSRGGYGSPLSYVMVNEGQPEKGFVPVKDSGTYQPPLILGMKLSYEFEIIPDVIKHNTFLYEDESVNNRTHTAYKPFIQAEDLMPDIYSDKSPSLYIGFNSVFAEQTVTLFAAVKTLGFSAGLPVKTKSTEDNFTWEYYNGKQWKTLGVIDNTDNFNQSGTIKFITPIDIQSLERFELKKFYWIRVCSRNRDTFNPKMLSGIYINTVPAVQAVTIMKEGLGSSNGQPGQKLRIGVTPVLPEQELFVCEPELPSDKELLEIEKEEGKDAVVRAVDDITGKEKIWVRWHEVQNFLGSDPHSRHYIIDRLNGNVTFGDGTKGMIPPHGINNIAINYRTGGGFKGNVPKHSVCKVSSTLPGVASVYNYEAAEGGSEGETMADMLERGPQTFRHRSYSVTASDFEWLVKQEFGSQIARIKCMQNTNKSMAFEPGWVSLIIIPNGTSAKLSPGPELIRQMRNYLFSSVPVSMSDRKSPRINIVGPGYIKVEVEVEVVPEDMDCAQQVKQRILDALNRFFHPLRGGPAEKGWEFGRDVFTSEICRLVESVQGVDRINLDRLKIKANTAQNLMKIHVEEGEEFTGVDIPAGSVVASIEEQSGRRIKYGTLIKPLFRGSKLFSIQVKGFKEGDRITRVLDLTVENKAEALGLITVYLGYEPSGFPAGSLISAKNGRISTNLKKSLPDGEDVVFLEVESDAEFFRELEPGDVITIYHPIPMTVISVAQAQGTQTLEIEPFVTGEVLAESSIISTLDGTVRLPLIMPYMPFKKVTSLLLKDFEKDDKVIIYRRDNSYENENIRVNNVQPVTDTIYLEDNFITYSGIHTVNINDGAN